MELILIFAIFIGIMWLLMIRPQQKRQREQREMIDSLARGDDVVTIGGLHGRIEELGEDYLDLEVYDDVILRFQKQAIARKVVPDQPETSST